MNKTEIEIPSGSPINNFKFGTQNAYVAFHLLTGQKINRYIAFMQYGIGDLHSRIPEVAKVFESYGIAIERQFISVPTKSGKSTCNEYWIDINLIPVKELQ